MTWFDMLDLLLAGYRQYMVHNGEFASLVWLIVPAGCDGIPNWVRQPSIPTWVYWTGWSFSGNSIGEHDLYVPSTIRQHPREDLIITG